MNTFLVAKSLFLNGGIMRRVLLILLMFKDISCEWTLNFNMHANVLYNAEVRGNHTCCCDTQTCYMYNSTSGLEFCSDKVGYECEVRVTIIVSDCPTCPSDCCLVYDVGNNETFQITNASFQIGDERIGPDWLSLNVLLKDIDGNFAVDVIDTMSFIIPVEQYATFAHFGKTPGFHGIAQFSLNYSLRRKYESWPGPSYFTGISKTSCPPMEPSTTTVTVTVPVVYTAAPPERLIGAYRTSVSVASTSYESPTNGACVEEASSFSNTTSLLLIGAVVIMTIIALVTTTISVRVTYILRQKRAQTKSVSVPTPEGQPVRGKKDIQEARLVGEPGVAELSEYMGVEEQPQYDQCTSRKSTHIRFEGDHEPTYDMCMLPSYVEANEFAQAASPYESPMHPTVRSDERSRSQAIDYETPQSWS